MSGLCDARWYHEIHDACAVCDPGIAETLVMPDGPDTSLTHLLQDVGRRDGAADELLPVVYDHLREIARRRMAGERSSHTLQATALVHEAYVKLIGDQDIEWESRSHFYGAAAQSMRRILIDHARKRLTDKRGGGRSRMPLNVLDLAGDHDPSQIIALDEALEKLEQEDPRAGEIVRLRFFAGLEVKETAQALELSERTVMRDWSFARARLYQLMSGEATDEAAPDA